MSPDPSTRSASPPSPGAVIRLAATERVALGNPAAEVIAAEAQRLGAARVFILTGVHLLRQTDEIRRIQVALGSRHAASHTGIGQHVPLRDVLAAADAARGVSADLIVAVGGGSVIDAAKMIGLCLKHDIREPAGFAPFRTRVSEAGDVIVPEFAGADIALICVPTTLSGGEFSPLAGATDEEARLKSVYEHPSMAPICVVLDPAITLHTPEWLWLSTGVRSIDHAVEALASLESNYFCDGMAESALRLLAQGLPRVKADPGDLDARAQCQVGAWQSMIPIIAGVPMGGSHAIGHILGGTCDVAHGHTSCVMSPHVLAWNFPVNGGRQKRISACLGMPEEAASELLDRLIRSLGMPRTLREVGVEEEMLPVIAANTLKDPWAPTNPRPLRRSEEVMAILQTALG